MLLAVRISSYGCTWEVWRALKKLELLSAAPRATLTLLSCSPNFPRASITRYTHAKHEPILEQNSTIKICIKTNNLIPNSTNLSHCLPVNFNNFIFNSTIFSQHQLHRLLNFNIAISLKIKVKINSNFNNLKPVKINDSKSVSTTQNSCQQIGSGLARFYRESLLVGRTKFVARQDGGRE